MRVALNPTFKQAISISSSEVIKIWDVIERVCLNTLIDIFPHPEFWVKIPISAFEWHDMSQSIIVCVSKELTILQLQRDTDAMASHTAHEVEVTCATYLDDIDIVCTGDTNGTISTWNMTLGDKQLEFKHAHFQGAITCLTPGFHGRRLVSGASNGEIFIWNVQAGIVLQQLIKLNPREVNGVLSLQDSILAIGDDGMVIRFQDHEDVDIAKAPMIVQQDRSFVANRAHTSDVTSSATCGDSLMASGSFDGEILIWNLKVRSDFTHVALEVLPQPVVDKSLLFAQKSGPDPCAHSSCPFLLLWCTAGFRRQVAVGGPIPGAVAIRVG